MRLKMSFAELQQFYLLFNVLIHSWLMVYFWLLPSILTVCIKNYALENVVSASVC